MLTQVPDSEMKYFASISIQSLKSTPDFIRNYQILYIFSDWKEKQGGKC